ncbi:endothelin-converting enzyme 1-like [Amblyomma americanum]
MVMAWKSKVPDTLLKGVARLPVGRKAAAMFNSCMTQTGLQVDVIKNFMSAHGLVWPEDPVGNSPGPVEVLFDLAFNWNVNLWFTLDLLPRAADDQQKRRLFIAPNNLMLEWRSIFRQIPRQFFDKVYRAMFRLFASGTDTSPPPDRITESYNRLKHVFDVMISSSTGKARVPAVLPLRELDDLTDLTNSTYIKRAIDTKLGIQPPFTMEDLILMSDVALLHAILNIFGEIDDSVVRRHLAWLFLEAYAAVASPATVLLILYGSKRRAEAVRPLFCAGQVEASYKLLVSAMVAVMQFSEEERRSVDTHLASILEMAVQKTSSADWFDNETQEVAAEKLRGMRSVVWPDKKFLTAEGLEEAYTNFPDNASSFADFWIQTRRSLRGLIGSDAGLQELRIGDSIELPYSQYVHVLNQLSLSLGAMAPPFYYKDGTKAMLHGGLGYIYAKELVGAVDSEGVKVDPLGNIVSSWLSDAVKPTFQDRVLGCLPGGNASLFPEVPAIEVAFAALKRSLKDNDVRLSEELTEEKVFFITVCLLSCSKKAADNLYGGDCNKAVANFAPFAEAFQCRLGSNMNPRTKCTFFD